MKKFKKVSDVNKYKTWFSEQRFWRKVRYYSRKAGVRVVYVALLLYYLLESRSVPLSAKSGIVAALGYFILPTDLIPDIVVMFGFTDDIAVMLFALSKVVDHITPEVKQKAKEKLSNWFENIDEAELKLLEQQIEVDPVD